MGKFDKDLEYKKMQSQVKELADALNYLKKKEEAEQRLLFFLLKNCCGGRFTITHKDFAEVSGSIKAINKEKSTIFYIEEKEEGDKP